MSFWFSTVQSVVIKNKPLSYINSFIMFVVLLYEVLYVTIMYHQYADFEIPNGVGNFYLGKAPNKSASLNTSYCGDHSQKEYAWGTNFDEDQLKFTGGWTFNSTGICSPTLPELHVRIGEGSFSVVTQETVTYRNGTVDARLISDPESTEINIIHVLSASFMPRGIVNAPCIIRNKDGNELASFSGGSIISGISIRDWLAFAEADLDTRNVQPWIHGGDLEYQPFFRVTGIVLLMRVEYSNLRFGELPSASLGSPRADITIEALPNTWGNLGYAQIPADSPDSGPVASVLQHGVTVQVVFTGSVGKASAVQIVLALVQAIVLLGTATQITDLVARYVLFRDGSYERAVERVEDLSAFKADSVPTLDEQAMEGLNPQLSGLEVEVLVDTGHMTSGKL